MVSLPKCAGCEYNNFMKVTCKLYPNGIPDDIFVEIKKCDYYKKRKEKYNKSDETHFLSQHFHIIALSFKPHKDAVTVTFGFNRMFITV